MAEVEDCSGGSVSKKTVWTIKSRRFFVIFILAVLFEVCQFIPGSTKAVQCTSGAEY